jgi:hypothetical protein
MSEREGRELGMRPARLKRPSRSSAARTIVTNISATMRIANGQP